MLKLEKGSRLNLEKELGLDYVKIGLAWGEKRFDTEEDYDADLTVFVLEEDGTPYGKVVTNAPHADGWVAFYNQTDLGNGAIKHSGDNKKGNAPGDDETIEIDFPKLPANVTRVAAIVTIHDAIKKNQNFGKMNSSAATVYDRSGKAVATFVPEEVPNSKATALIFIEAKKNSSGQWVIQTIAEGFEKGLADFFTAYKVPGY